MIGDGLKGMEEELKSPVEQLDVAELLERAVTFDAKPATSAATESAAAPA
jgi:hypothetical protein